MQLLKLIPCWIIPKVRSHVKDGHLSNCCAGTIGLSNKIRKETAVPEHPVPTFSIFSYASTRGIPPTAPSSRFSTSSSFTLSSDTQSISSKLSSTTLHAENDFPAVPIDEELPDDPDIFAFAFQEADLSAEALLYSTSTVREDAWTTAILAALGEKAVYYEKVIIHRYRTAGVMISIPCMAASIQTAGRYTFDDNRKIVFKAVLH